MGNVRQITFDTPNEPQENMFSFSINIGFHTYF